MPPKKATPADGAEQPTGLRDNELRFIKAVFDNMTEKPDADWSRVAEAVGLKDAKCARERFRQMSIRHGWGTQTPGSNVSSPVKAGKKTSSAVAADGKVSKKPRTPRKAVKKEIFDEDGDDEGIKAEDGEEIA